MRTLGTRARNRADEATKLTPLTRKEMENLSQELSGTPLGEQLKQIAKWRKAEEEGKIIMDLIIPVVKKRTDGETVTYHIISSGWERDRGGMHKKRSTEEIYAADGSLIPDNSSLESLLEDVMQRLQQGITPKVPATSDLAKYMAEHPDVVAHRIGYTYTIFPKDLQGEILRFSLGGTRLGVTAEQQRAPQAEPAPTSQTPAMLRRPMRGTDRQTGDLSQERVTYEPGRYAPADLSKIPADSDLGKILREYPDANVQMVIRKGKQGYSVTWGKKFNRPTDKIPRYMGTFDMNGQQISIAQFKSGAFKSGQDKITTKTPKTNKLVANRMVSKKERD